MKGSLFPRIHRLVIEIVALILLLVGAAKLIANEIASFIK